MSILFSKALSIVRSKGDTTIYLKIQGTPSPLFSTTSTQEVILSSWGKYSNTNPNLYKFYPNWRPPRGLLHTSKLSHLFNATNKKHKLIRRQIPYQCNLALPLDLNPLTLRANLPTWDQWGVITLRHRAYTTNSKTSQFGNQNVKLPPPPVPHLSGLLEHLGFYWEFLHQYIGC